MTNIFSRQVTKMTNRLPKGKLVSLIAILALFAGVLPFASKPAHADVPGMEAIRVALFVNIRGTVPSVTLSAASPLTLGVRTDNGMQDWIRGGNKARLALDQYWIRAAVTEDFAAANDLRAALANFVNEARIFGETYKGRARFAVTAGPYPTRQQAEQAINRLKDQARFANSPLELKGSHYWSAGSYGSMADAERQLNRLQQAGLEAQLAVQWRDGQTRYDVWLGAAPDSTALQLARTEALKIMPDLNLAAVNASQPYIVLKQDVSAGLNQSVPFYAVQAGGARIAIRAEGETPVTVQERFGRSYRGWMEISAHEGVLALVNELPLEQYLYSVVGREMSGSWPTEALKAQAVAARTYAVGAGLKYGIAHVSDTTFDQAYPGIESESAATRQAVDETKGEVLMKNNRLISAVYHSNAGGITADGSEVWGNELDYLQSVTSPDTGAQEGKLTWNRIALPNGLVGYVRSDFTKDTGLTNAAGLKILEADGIGVNVRPAPYVDNANNAPVAQINTGDRFVLLEQTVESNNYSWLRGPYTAAELLASINSNALQPIQGPLKTLKVTERGPSGRVMTIEANGQPVKVSYPDRYRSALKGVMSTLLDIEEMNRVTVLAADGVKQERAVADGLHVLTASQPAISRPLSGEYVLALGENAKTRVLSREVLFRITGRGFGHGLGMSQWGAKKMAESGQSYKEILQHYYQGVEIKGSAQ